ncbi:hypothetical protein DSM104299_02449 [Baekduia alba]|uniref:hypothetical protein n=1 Tax=Baekduia alba TaxID=2997333 RepID=UPI002342291E|nr:hypothetical protein [Baekduia alba]WCB93733.1 hypothetical protein DSM104299_02449 [Baekduia alba]
MRPTLTGIEQVLADAGGADAPRERIGQLRQLLGQELQHGAAELAQSRSGYDHPVVLAVAETRREGGGLIAVAPVAPGLRADPDAVDERAWLLTAALVGALADATDRPTRIEAGHFDDFLAIRVTSARGHGDPELAPLAFDTDHIAPVDRLKAQLLAVPPALLDDAADFKAPIGPAHPLNVALEVAKLQGRPADPQSVAEHEDAILTALEASRPAQATRPHDDPDPSRRVARRILQRLDGMGKWGGYHTDFTHLARGFAGNDRALADEVGEALLLSGLLAEKPSVGQRHVFLNPRRAADIRGLIERGDVPPDLELPS